MSEDLLGPSHFGDTTTLSSGRVEFHFLFFYDFKVRVIPPANRLLGVVDTFDSRAVGASELSQFYFSDNFPDRLVRLHLHGSIETLNEHGDVAGVTRWDATGPSRRRFRIAEMQNVLFEFPEKPLGVDDLVPSFSFLEVTLFSNGMLTILVRTTNASPITHRQCVDFIRHPEFPIAGSTMPYHPGPGVVFATRMLPAIERRLSDALNKFRLHGITIFDGVRRRLRFTDTRSPARRVKAEIGPEGEIPCPLDPSRPYVGALFNLSPQMTTPNDNIRKLVIACARATPPFLDEFTEADQYLTKEEPRRNIYYPGPSIVLIGRRGWSCAMIGSQKPLAFQMGVVETALFAISALNASVRATRRYIDEILLEGQRIGHSLNNQLGRLSGRRRRLWEAVKTWRRPERTDFFRRRRLSNAIHKYAAFLGKARLNSPCDDVSSLLDSYLITHTGISAVHRIKRITGHDGLINTARQTMAAYHSFLATAADYWQQVTVNHGRWQLLLAIMALIVAIISSRWFGW